MIPKSHPRYESLKIRDRVAEGVRKGITSPHGLIAHGRGEAFDYLLGEKTHGFAKGSIHAAAALLLLANHPVISVNGNAAALSPKELATLSAVLLCPLEVNIFHSSKKRERKIRDHLLWNGAKKVLLPGRNHSLRYLESNRRFAHPEGIAQADVVFVPLEDGDRAEALAKNGKKAVTIDLNPLSRTAQCSAITIVDNITRAMPLLIAAVKSLRGKDHTHLEKITKNYNNKKNLKEAIAHIREG